MNDWIELCDEQPTVDEIVEVWMSFGQGGTTQLRGYRLASRAGGESLWLNALTHEPFPDGWHVVRWRPAEGTTVERSVGAQPDGPPR